MLTPRIRSTRVVRIAVSHLRSTHMWQATEREINRIALKSGIDGHLESPQVGHSRPANTAQRLNSFYVVASSD